MNTCCHPELVGASRKSYTWYGLAVALQALFMQRIVILLGNSFIHTIVNTSLHPDCVYFAERLFTALCTWAWVVSVMVSAPW